jgi:uncharacterized membrane protein
MPSTPGERTEQRAEISEALQDNLDKVASFSQREEAKASPAQRTIERITLFFGNPRVLLAFVAFCVLWIVTDCVFKYLRGAYFDGPPFSLLQGVITFFGVLITMAVLIRQNRLARIEEQRAHLELQVNLLSEQKTTKIIQLLEELRRDLPNVQDRHDPHAEALQALTNPDAVLDAIENQRAEDRS